MHYGKYASMYLKRTFFFDANPPLGKMIIALGGYLAGFKGDFGFDKIGVPYPDDVPVAGLRFFPALCGSLLTPTIYLILCELGMSHWAGGLAGVLMLLGMKKKNRIFQSFCNIFKCISDTAFLAQSRFILLESIMMFFAFVAVLSVLKMRRYSGSPFGIGWWFWLSSASINMGLAFSVKYLAFYSCLLCLAIFCRDFWRRLNNRGVTNLQLCVEYVIQSSF